MKTKASGENAKLIMDGEIHVGTALLLSNDRWAPFNTNENVRLVEMGISFKTPGDVRKFFELWKKN